MWGTTKKKHLIFGEGCERTDQVRYGRPLQRLQQANCTSYDHLLVSCIGRKISEASVLGKKSVIRSHAALVTLSRITNDSERHFIFLLLLFFSKQRTQHLQGLSVRKSAQRPVRAHYPFFTSDLPFPWTI